MIVKQFPQLVDVIKLHIKDALTNIHTAIPAKVTKVNATTVNAKPVINRDIDGKSIELPEFIEIPVLFSQGGSSYTAYPISIGDYCLLIFSERCFDLWYAGRDFLSPPEFRMHDYSDAIAIMGINPLSTAIPIPSVITQVGDVSETGNYVQSGDRNQTGDFTLTGDYTQTGSFKLTGDMLVDGNITCTGTISAANFSGLSGGTMTSSSSISTSGEMTANGKNLSSHTHPYSWTGSPGSSNTSAPN